MKGTKARRHEGSNGLAFVFVAIVSFISPAYADDISLPLNGYFHSGRAMPVKWSVSESSAVIEISASDAVTTRLICSGRPPGIVPWIAVDPNAGHLLWRSSSGAAGEISGLHPLDESDCLVATTLANDAGVARSSPIAGSSPFISMRKNCGLRRWRGRPWTRSF